MAQSLGRTSNISGVSPKIQWSADNQNIKICKHLSKIRFIACKAPVPLPKLRLREECLLTRVPLTILLAAVLSLFFLQSFLQFSDSVTETQQRQEQN